MLIWAWYNELGWRYIQLTVRFFLHNIKQKLVHPSCWHFWLKILTFPKIMWNLFHFETGDFTHHVTDEVVDNLATICQDNNRKRVKVSP